MKPQAVILLGGQGTRLHAQFPDLPKALVPIAGKPFIDWQVEWLRRGGIGHIHCAAGHLAAAIEAWADGKNEISVSCEPEPLGTAGALKFIEPFIEPSPFFVVNGDTLLPGLDFQRLEKYPLLHSNDWKVYMAVSKMEGIDRYGTVEFDARGEVTAFREKANGKDGWVNGGVYWMAPSTLADLPAGRFCSLETETFPQLVAERRLIAHPTAPPHLDMGTPEGLAKTEAYLARLEPEKISN
jgi:D-glycero-alpha-D-manno-heptose 1-phosphate guanylyltransferase